MTMKNKYSFRSKISESKTKELVKLFSLDLTASQIAKVANLNRNTVNRYLMRIRESIALHCESQSPLGNKLKKPGENYIVCCMQRLLGREVRGENVFFALFRYTGNIYTQIIADTSQIKSCSPKRCASKTLQPFGAPFIAEEIFEFLDFARDRLVSFRGLPRHTFYFHLKECEFRFNHQKDDLTQMILKMLKEYCINEY